MARAYFQNLPLIQYGNQNLRNILLNARLSRTALENASAFYPYTLSDGETPTTVAFDYYGDIEYAWLVYFSNNIVDPVTQWFKTDEQFRAYMTSLYGSEQAARASIHHYVKSNDATYPSVTVGTYNLMSNDERTGLVPVYAWDMYDRINQGRRVIQLVDRNFAPQIALELEKDLNG